MSVLPLILLLFGGWGLGRLLLPEENEVSVIAAHGWLLGTILVSVSLAVLGIFLSGWALVGAVTVACVLPAIVALRKSPGQFVWRPPRGVADWVLCAVILCECAVLFRFARTTALGWDGLMVWEIKARIAFANGGRLPVDFFSDPTRVWSHPDYPLMLPMLEDWVYLWIGESNQFVVRVLFPGYYVTALLLIYSGVAEAAGKRWAGLVAAALLFFVPFLTVGQFNLFTGYADFPLAVYYLAAVVCLIRWMRKSDVRQAMLFGIYAGALPWVKREGTVLWVCVMAVAGAEFLRRREGRVALRAAVPGVIVIAMWKIALGFLRVSPNQDFMRPTLGNVVGNIGRVGPILHDVVYELGSIADWSVLWFLFPLALVVIAARGRGRLALQLGAIVLMPLVIYSSVYVLSNWGSYEAHVATSLARLISHLALVALVAVGIGLRFVGPEV